MPLVPADSSRTADDVGGATAGTLPRSIIVLLGIAGVVAMGVGIKAAAGIVAPAMLALVLTIAVLPVGRWAREHSWPGWLATLAALVAAYLILLVMVVGPRRLPDQVRGPASHVRRGVQGPHRRRSRTASRRSA